MPCELRDLSRSTELASVWPMRRIVVANSDQSTQPLPSTKAVLRGYDAWSLADTDASFSSIKGRRVPPPHVHREHDEIFYILEGGSPSSSATQLRRPARARWFGFLGARGTDSGFSPDRRHSWLPFLPDWRDSSTNLGRA